MTIDECVYPGCVVEGDYPIVRLTDEEWVREWVRRTPGARVSADIDWVSVCLSTGYLSDTGYEYINRVGWSKVREALGGVTLTLPYKPMEG